MIYQTRNLIGALLQWGLWLLVSAIEAIAPWRVAAACSEAGA